MTSPIVRRPSWRALGVDELQLAIRNPCKLQWEKNQSLIYRDRRMLAIGANDIRESRATFSEPEVTTDHGEPELTDKIVAASVAVSVAATQGDSASASSTRGKVEGNQLQSTEFKVLKANYNRVRQMLYEEQRKPRNIYLECVTCMK